MARDGRFTAIVSAKIRRRPRFGEAEPDQFEGLLHLRPLPGPAQMAHDLRIRVELDLTLQVVVAQRHELNPRSP